MYRHIFVNRPDLTAALGQISPSDFLALLRTAPAIACFTAGWGQARLERVEMLDKAFLERWPLIGQGELTPERLLRLAYEVNDAIPSMTTNPSRAFIDAIGYVLMNYCRLITYLDAGGGEAAAGVAARQVDWEKLEAMERAVKHKDPKYIADNVVSRLMSGNQHTYNLLVKSLGRIVEREVRKDAGWLARQDDQHFMHVRDWIRSAVANNAPWISNVNDIGCPKKLAKCGSVAALVAEADKQMRKDLNRQRTLFGDSEEVFAEEDGGFHMVRLRTEAALDRESETMRHCIGLGSYDRLLKEDGYLYLSLRDKFGRPHATIEAIKGKIVQFQGKANTVPKAEYRDATVRLLAPHRIEFLVGSSILDNLCGEINMGDVRQAPHQELGGYPFANPAA